MSKLKISIKSHPLQSLAIRIFLLSLCLLVIPLFFHSVLLYKKEYEGRLEDVRLTLQVIAESQKALLEDRISDEKEILNMAIEAPSLKKTLNIVEFSPSEKTEESTRIEKNTLVVQRSTPEGTILERTVSVQSLIDFLIHFEHAPYKIRLAFVNQQGSLIGGDQFISPLSIILPIQNGNFSILLTADVESIAVLHKQQYILHFISLFFLVGVLGGTLVWLFTKRMAKPLKSLMHTMEQVGQGALHLRYQADWMGFEINTLGQNLNLMLEALFTHQKIAEEAKLSRERLAEELKIGRTIQMSLLPSFTSPYKNILIGTSFLPAREVSGDFYDFLPLENGSFYIGIGDTAGKGISACLYAITIRSMLRSLISTSHSLEKTLLQANDLFSKDAKDSGMFVTLWIALYDPKTQTLSYCSQGHPPSFLIRNGMIQELSTHGLSLGIDCLQRVEIQHVSLQKKDRLCLYTDGLLEALNTNQEMFGKLRLKTALLQDPFLSNPDYIRQLFETITLFTKETPQHDDMAFLTLMFD